MNRTLRRSIAAAGAAGLACALQACVPSAPQPTPAPTPTPTPTPDQIDDLPRPTYENWMDAPQTPGDWTYRNVGTESLAAFTGMDGSQHFQFTCTAQRAITLTAFGTAPGASAMTIRTETVERAVRAVASQNAVTATLPARDPLLDAMAFSKGRFAVQIQGLPGLYLPAWPEITRVIEDCR